MDSNKVEDMNCDKVEDKYEWRLKKNIWVHIRIETK